MTRLLVAAALLHVFVALRLLPGLREAGAGLPLLTAAALYLAASAVLITLAMVSRRMPAPRRDRLAWPGFVMMGVFSFLWVLTVLRDLVLIALYAAQDLLPAFISAQNGLERLSAASAVAIPLLSGLAGGVGYVNARRRARVHKVAIKIANLAPALQGLRIAQITDVHVGPTIKRPYLQAIVDAVNALEPDLVAVTGDMVDGSVEQLAPEVAPLAQLRSRHGTFFVTGNHEYYSGAHAWLAEMRRLGLRVLLNEHAQLHHQGATVLVAGISDWSAHHFDAAHRSDAAKAVAGAPAADFRLLLAHQPRSAAAASLLGFDLQLSGHTHGGQFLPWPWLVRLQQPFTAGLHRVGDMLVYVSRGAGYWGPPLRLGAPSEITLLTLLKG